MNLRELILKYIDNGYNNLDANYKVSQDIMLVLLAHSKYSKNATIKGGVVMHNISNDKRRATRDLDFDFIKYSLEDNSIKEFIQELNRNPLGLKIKIDGPIKRLHQQDYDGKRVNVKIYDNFGYNIETKLDIGVYKDFEIEQEEYCFNLTGLNENITLLINSPEQVFCEKMKSFLKFGLRSTRYKDIFDFYYLINFYKLDKSKMLKYMSKIIFSDMNMRENNVKDVIERIDSIFNSSYYKEKLRNPAVNWIDVDVDEVINIILNYFKSINNEVSVWII